jgi:hypothetical protein
VGLDVGSGRKRAFRTKIEYNVVTDIKMRHSDSIYMAL